MTTKLFVNVPVENLERAEAFFTDLGFDFFGMAPGMASVIINQDTHVMLLAQPTFAGYARNPVADAATTTELVLVLGLETPAAVDELVDKAVAAGAASTGEPRTEGGRYSRGFADLDGHQWEALCLV